MSQYARWCFAWLAACGLAACDASEETGDFATASGGQPPCAADAFIGETGACERAGVPDGMCGPGERLLQDGSCQAAGVPPLACPDGFVAGGEGCSAILPDTACADGTLAMPGETECRAVAACPAGKWPELPPGASPVEHVDGSYAGADSDGTEAHPWVTVQAAVDAAGKDAWVAIAAGTYQEAITISDKTLRLVGVCPERVHIAGAGEPAITIRDGADASALRGLDITGPSLGVLLSGSEEVVLEELWIHDTGVRGINVESTLGPTSLSLRSSLIERATEIGVYVSGAQVTIEDVAVRDTRTQGNLFGRGLVVVSNGADAADAQVSRSVFEGNSEANVFVGGATARLEACVSRNPRPGGDGAATALAAQMDPDGKRASVTAVGSVFEGCRGYCVLATASDVELEAVTVRDTALEDSGAFGFGVSAQSSPSGRAGVTVRSSLVERSVGMGIKAGGSDLVLEGTVVRDVAIDEVIGSGLGVYVHGELDSPARGALTMIGSVVERAHDSGVVVAVSDAVIEGVVVRDTNPDAAGWYGRGLAVDRATAEVRGSLFTNNSEMGIFAIASELLVERCEIRDVRANGDGRFGDGITMVSDGGVAMNARILGSRIEGVHRAGIASFGAHVAFGRTLVGCAGYPLEGEHFAGAQYAFEKVGEMLCGCPAAEGECQVLSSGIEAPTALPTLP
jgi:hypothetical protein